jgi:hypothetical protein
VHIYYRRWLVCFQHTSMTSSKICLETSCTELANQLKPIFKWEKVLSISQFGIMLMVFCLTIPNPLLLCSFSQNIAPGSVHACSILQRTEALERKHYLCFKIGVGTVGRETKKIS